MENGNKYFQGPQDFKKIPNPPGLRYADKGEHARFNFRHMKSAYWRKGALPQKGTDIWVSDSYITMRKFFKEIVGGVMIIFQRLCMIFLNTVLAVFKKNF